MKLYHIFPDLMNLYGDYGNLAALKKALEDAGETAEILPLRPGETADFSDAAFLYMGPGTEPARDAALGHLRPLADALREALLVKNTPALFVGNAWPLLGKTVTRGDGSVLDGLGLFDFSAVESRDRYTGDAIATPCAPLPQAPAVGFLNRCDTVSGVSAPMFTLQMGKGSDGGRNEGFLHGRFHATHLTGPLLVKNSHLLDYFVSLLGVDPPARDDNGHPAQAYRVTLDALRARLAQQG